MVVATPPNAVTTCSGGTLTAVAGAGVVSYTDGSLAPQASCTVGVDVTSSTVGTHVNTTGDLTSSRGSSGTAQASLTVLEGPGADAGPGDLDAGVSADASAPEASDKKKGCNCKASGSPGSPGDGFAGTLLLWLLALAVRRRL